MNIKKKPKPQKVAYIDRCLITNPLHVGLCLSESAFLKELKRLNVEDYPFSWMSVGCGGKVHYLENKFGDKTLIICIYREKHRCKTELYGMVAHEVMHVWQAIKDDLGENSPSPEFEAYAVQGLVQAVMAEFK